ncbi:MAG: hypothetical protein RLZZ319_295, partial [Actinomycetota bacterium]
AELVNEFDTVRRELVETIDGFLGGAPEKQSLATITAILGRVRLTDAIDGIVATAAEHGWLAVSCRTSAALEDSHGTSFAGQYESFVDVHPAADAIAESVLACFRSLVSPRVIRYAKSQGLTHFEVGGSVIVQEMFFGTESGVLFSENGSGAMSIASVPSWRNDVVEGADATEYVVPRKSVATAPIPDHIRTLCTEAFALELATGTPVDIEWSFDGRTLAFLQYRPVTTPMRDYTLEWDSTNISENYPGVTLPLTYSVIRQLYAGVYPAFLRLLGTSDARLRANSAVFDNMLGYVDGHVFYRISNWYEVVRFLPGRANQEFFEAMLNPVTKRGRRARGTRLDVASIGAMVRFVWLLARSEARSRRFRETFADKLLFFQSYHPDFVNAAAILDETKRIRQEMLADWATPILNDVKLMVFHGMLARFFTDETRADYLDFLQGLSDRASLAPLEELATLGRNVAAALEATGSKDIATLRGTAQWSGVATEATRYVARFGARTPGELKLETERLTDRLDDVLELALKATNSTVSTVEPPRAIPSWPAHISRWKRPLLGWIAGHTRRAIDWRERFRFNRAQTFNLSRISFDSIGRSLAAEGVILSSRDIYWLTEQEIDEIVNGHAWSYDVTELIERRQREFDDYERSEISLAVRGSGRIATRHISPVIPADASDVLTGNGVAPGELTAPVVVAREFDPTLDVRGKILVVHHIDPGWTLLFTQAAGIIAERGNALSHAAIIAREIGIPAIVAVPDATARLATGETITINGVVGSIRRESN